VGFAALDKTGTTQLRVYFDLDDNDDGGNDYHLLARRILS
jgi:hypothetical protein